MWNRVGYEPAFNNDVSATIKNSVKLARPAEFVERNINKAPRSLWPIGLGASSGYCATHVADA